jgi:spermidine/putrescine-binding protein
MAKKLKQHCMKKILTGGLLTLMLAGCTSNSEVLNIFAWASYLEPKLIADFEEHYRKETGKSIKVIYSTYDSNLTPHNALKHGEPYDLVCPSGFKVKQMILDSLLQPIDHSRVTPLTAYLQQWLNLEFDPGNRYSIPCTYGATGILYNTSHANVDRADMNTWGVLWNPKYSGRILANNSPIELYLATLRYLNSDRLVRASCGFTYPPSFRDTLQAIMNQNSETSIGEVMKALSVQRRLLKGYFGKERRDMMVEGQDDCTVCLCYSNEAAYAMANNKTLEFCIPQEGSNYFVDSWVIPRTAQNLNAAYAFLHFITRPENALLNVVERRAPSMIAGVSHTYTNSIEADPTFVEGTTPEWRKIYYNTLFFSGEHEKYLAPYLLADNHFHDRLMNMFYSTMSDKYELKKKE